MKYRVHNRDVDGTSSRTYKGLDSAKIRFKDMVGWTVEAAVAESYDNLGLMLPESSRIETLLTYGLVIRAVGTFGNVVSLSAVK